MTRVQKKTFERWEGQVVYRTVCPSVGPYRDKVVGIRRGVIQVIFERKDRFGDYTFANGRQLHATLFDVDIVWQDLSVTKNALPTGFNMRGNNGSYYHDRVERPFDYGLITTFEMDILLRGGLLGKDVGIFDEPQSEELIKTLPLYQLVVDNPDATHHFNPALERIV